MEETINIHYQNTRQNCGGLCDLCEPKIVWLTKSLKNYALNTIFANTRLNQRNEINKNNRPLGCYPSWG